MMPLKTPPAPAGSPRRAPLRAARLRGVAAALVVVAIVSVSAMWRPSPQPVLGRSYGLAPERRGLGQLLAAGGAAAAAPPPAAAAPVVVVVISRYREDVSWLVDNSTGAPLGGLDVRLYQSADIDAWPESCAPVFPGLPPPEALAAAPRRLLPGWPEWAAAYVAEKNATKLLAPAGSARDAERMARAKAGLPQREPPAAASEDKDEGEDEDEYAPEAPQGWWPGDRAGPRARAAFEAAAAALAPRRRAPVVVVPEVSGVLPLRIVPNRGAEAMAFAAALVDSYDELPEVLVFMHAHRTAWHTMLPQSWSLKRLGAHTPRLRRGYSSALCLEPNGPYRMSLLFPSSIDANWESWNGPLWHEDLAAHYRQAWREFLGPALGLPLPAFTRQPAAATFAVTRDAVRRHPKAFYAALRQWLMDTPMELKMAGIVLEFAWHIIFTGEADFDPPQEDCMCDVYRVCRSAGGEVE